MTFLPHIVVKRSANDECDNREFSAFKFLHHMNSCGRDGSFVSGRKTILRSGDDEGVGSSN